jgi:NADH:ubiquinone oxidoreductase subunit 5 (subunit L)/multisubunit Na+/H+ antiporter MnhA subunit
VLSTMSSIHNMSFIFFRIWTTRIKKTIKKSKKQRSEQPWTLAYPLVLQIMSSLWSSFFWLGPIHFPSKMIPHKLNRNLICLDPRPLSKGLGTNFKLLTNRNAQFHWMLLFGCLSKLALNSWVGHYFVTTYVKNRRGWGQRALTCY